MDFPELEKNIQEFIDDVEKSMDDKDESKDEDQDEHRVKEVV